MKEHHYTILYLSIHENNNNYLEMVEEIAVKPVIKHTYFDALDYLLESSVDIILIDSSFDNTEITTFLHYIKDDIENHETPIVLCTTPQNQDTLAQITSQFNVVSIFSNSHRFMNVTKLFMLLKKQKTDVKNIENSLEQSVDRGMTDQLTGAYNRYGCDEVYYKLLTREEVYEEPFSMLLLDIDHFKSINDTYGHDVGDEVLVSFAKIILSSIRKKDTFVRLGGEEFIIFLSNVTIDIAVKIAEKMRISIEEASHSTQNINATASFGVVAYEKGLEFTELFKRADSLLYKAKASGRNMVLAE